MTSRAFRLAFLIAGLACLLSCKVSESTKPDTLTFRLPDSLRVADGKYDSVRLELYAINGTDTVLVDTLFSGAYAHPAQLAGLPLPEGLDGNFLVRVSGFVDHKKTLDLGVPFTDGQAARQPITYPIPEKPANRAPAFTSGLEARSLREGEVLSVTLKARDEDGDAVTITLQNLDSLRGQFPERPGAITVTTDADSLVLRFDPGSAPGNYRFRVAVRDTAGAIDVQILVLSVGKVNRPPALSFAAPNPGPSFRVSEGQTLSLRVAAADPDSGDRIRLLPLEQPSWAACGVVAYDTSTGVFTFTPGFACVANGESVLARPVFRATDNGAPSEAGEITATLTVVDVNTAPRWAAGPVSLTGKEGKGMTLDLGERYLGDAEQDSVSFSATCGAIASNPLRWSFHPGFRDSGQKVCTLTATDSHQPPASSQLILQLTIADSARALEVDILSPTRGAFFRDSVIRVSWQIEGIAQNRDTTEKLLKEGANLVRRSFRDSLGNEGFDTVTVFLDTKVPGTPLVRSLGWTNQVKPRWTWRSGGGGSGQYRVRLDTLLSQGGISVNDTAFIPPWNLAEGRHVLYVQERDEAGNWSPVDSGVVRVDVTPPAVAITGPVDGHVTNLSSLSVAWSVDGNPQTPFNQTLTEGSNTVSRSVTDSAGNTGSRSITVTLRSKVVFVNAGALASGGDGNSWATAMRTLQAALEKSQNGWEIWVAKGIYKPGDGVINADTSFILKIGTALYGGFSGTEKSREERNWKSNETILSGDQGQLGVIEDNTRTIIKAGNNTKLNGVIVEKGYLYPAIVFTTARGEISNCVIRENFTTLDHGASGIGMSESDVTIENCDFLRNIGGDGSAISIYSSFATITSSKFIENEGGSATAVRIYGASIPRFQSCIFQRNKGNGSAIWVRDNTVLDFTNCIFIDNASLFGSGALRLNNERNTLQNCVFAGNSGLKGGVFELSKASLSATNCTFFDNRATDSGGVIYSLARFDMYPAIKIRNSIFWENRAGLGGLDIAIQSDETSSTTLDIDFSNIASGPNNLALIGTNQIQIGSSVFSRNPLFKNSGNVAGADGALLTADDGLTLNGGPCINAGTAEGTHAIDILGQPRIQGSAVDLGAYEQ